MNRRKFLTLGSGLVFPFPSTIRALAEWSSPDPYAMPELPGYPAGYQDCNGRTQIPALPLGERTGVLVSFGDSLMSNTVDSLYVPTQRSNQNFNVYDGQVYRTAEPILGCNLNSGNRHSGCFMTRAADMLIDKGVYLRFIHAPVAVGGSLMADYAVGGAINGRFAPTKARLDAAGLTATGIFCMLGANDSNAGTDHASAAASLKSIVATVRGLWPTTNLFIARHTNFARRTSAAIAAAQEAALDTPGKVFFGGDMDSLASSSGNYWDNTHFNATGAAAAAALAVAAISARP